MVRRRRRCQERRGTRNDVLGEIYARNDKVLGRRDARIIRIRNRGERLIRKTKEMQGKIRMKEDTKGITRTEEEVSGVIKKEELKRKKRCNEC
jgi:hypothetical protein